MSNWNTEEMSRWISNTETMYNRCRDADARYIQNFVKGYIGQGRPDGFTVELTLVDWDAVAADMEVV